MANTNVKPQVDVQLSTGTARLGDLIGMDIQVHHPLYLQVDTPQWPKALATFEVRDSTTLPLQVNTTETITHFQLALQNFTTGPQVLPPVDIAYRDLMGKEQTVKTSSYTVVIQEVPADGKNNGDIHGIRGVVGPVGWSPWWWLLIVILIGAMAGALWLTRQRVIQGPPPPPPEPGDTKALRRLQNLLSKGWVEAGQLKEFYIELSDIERAYIEDTFNVSALERTTMEIMRPMRKRTDVTQAALHELQALLESCDLVKFAKFRPDADEALKDHAAAVRFVEATRKKRDA